MIQSDTPIGWQDYLTILLRRKWFFVLPCASIVAISLIIGMFLPRIYRAETVLMIENQQVINPLIQGLAVSTSMGQRLRTLREELLSWTSLSRLVHELGMDRHAQNPVAFESLVRRIQQTINVRMRGDSLVSISYEDENPELAQRVVNTITQIYMDRSLEDQSADAQTAIRFLNSEMSVYQKKLEDSERALREFKELYVMQMPVATELNQQVIDLEVLLARLSVENTELHPRVIDTRRQIGELKRRRNEEIKRVISSALSQGRDPQLYADLAKALDAPVGDEASAPTSPTIRAAREAYETWVKRLDTTAASASQGMPQVQVVTAPQGGGSNAGLVDVVGGAAATSISLAPRQEQELARLGRDYETSASTYQHLQQRHEQAKITQRLGDSDQGTKFKVLEPARLPLKPVKPNLAKLGLFGWFLGIFVGAAAVFMAEYLDQSFQSAEELQAALAVPMLGSISTIMTEQDLEDRRQRRKSWISIQEWRGRLKQYARPVVQWGDRLLLKWGL
jgi:uncharacterized protein involved in exopolysaccharide biosynthesis